jgi:carbonic anhydrase
MSQSPSLDAGEGSTNDPQPEAAVTRRRLIQAGALGAAALGAEQMVPSEALAASKPPRRPSTPAGTLKVLMDGNARYVAGKIRRVDYNRLGDRIAETQKPLAAIITCADSRLSPSVIFDLGLGNVFVSRVAGNSIDPGTLGSTEYAVAELGVHLVMVLGHSNCGAVKAAIAVANGKKKFPAKKYGAIGQVVNAVVGPVRTVPRSQRTLPRSIAANARAQALHVAGRGPIISSAVRSGQIQVVAAVYDIRTGRVSLV